MIQTKAEGQQHKKHGHLRFICMILVQTEAAGKRMLAWGQTLKGFKKTFNHRKQSLVFLLVWQITQNDDAKQKCQENAGDNSSGRPPRMIRTAQDYGHKA